ncbi:hypothetical protein AGMMS49938_18080 [Fibrobacterales bacterium]|nr:hypothetical protein AGMMS49938_18080 [Fibrobacterales bacterium]
MLNFTARSFKTFTEVILWINLIASIIVGAYIGGVNHSLPGLVLGLIAGLIVGLLENILIGGFIAVFLRIDENLKTLVELNGGESSKTDEGSKYYYNERIK